MKLISLFLLFVSLIAEAGDPLSIDPGLKIEIIKSTDSVWTIQYTTAEPAHQLNFLRNPDNSRTIRWSPISDDFQITHGLNKETSENVEFISRKDGNAFNAVKLKLTPTYKHLPKDYAPFSPYSDGGMLIYTGRLFACVGPCDDNFNEWHISLKVPKNEHVIVNGEIYENSAQWIDSDEGKNVYVGTAVPIRTVSVITVIDKGLPKEIRSSLNDEIPKLMIYFKSRLGALSGNKPTLFASYANTPGSSSQGGTLPNQIFMHWDYNDLDEKIKAKNFVNKVLWFFAHEVAHLYQRSELGNNFGDSHESWIHEGHAEYLAANALQALYPQSSEYVAKKIDDYKSNCTKGLSQISLRNASKSDQFSLYYSCGLLIHQAIDKTVNASSTSNRKDIFDVWNEYRRQIKSGNPKGSKTFYMVIENFVSNDWANQLEVLINEIHANPQTVWNLLELTD